MSSWVCFELHCGEAFSNAGALGRHRSAVHGLGRPRATSRRTTSAAAQPLAPGNAGSTHSAAAHHDGPRSNGESSSNGAATGDGDGPRGHGGSSNNGAPAGNHDAPRGSGDSSSGSGGGDAIARGEHGDRPDAHGDGGHGDVAAAAAAAAASTTCGAGDPVLRPAIARFAELVQAMHLTQFQADMLLNYLHRVDADDIQQLPAQSRTVMRHVERFGTLALLRAAERGGAAMPAGGGGDWGDFSLRRYTYAGSGGRANVHVERTYDVHARDIWGVLVQSFLVDRQVAPQLHVGFVRACTEDGGRLCSEMWTGDWWAQAEKALPLGTDALPT